MRAVLLIRCVFFRAKREWFRIYLCCRRKKCFWWTEFFLRVQNSGREQVCTIRERIEPRAITAEITKNITEKKRSILSFVQRAIDLPRLTLRSLLGVNSCTVFPTLSVRIHHPPFVIPLTAVRAGAGLSAGVYSVKALQVLLSPGPPELGAE